jgi:predicted lipid-binding transport protein (Tim44 family)
MLGAHVMTPLEIRAVAARIKTETGIDVLDSSADAATARAATRRAGRQIAGTLGGSLAGSLGMVCIVLAFAHGDASAGLRAAFAVIGVAVAASSAALIVWAWRTPAAYAELYVKRQQTLQRFFAEIGQPQPSPLADADWLTRKAMAAFSTPGEVKAMREEAVSPPPNPERP